jgi:tRNA pseudouridine32 synthase / 23S rRNA pseudouridine746 synthase
MEPETCANASDIELVFQDEALLVLNKPPGLLSVPGRGSDKQDCLSSRVQQRYPNALVVHRLDMATSGLIVMARNAAVQRTLNTAFAQRQMHKRYLAVVAGKPTHSSITPNQSGKWQTIELPIIVDWPNRPLRVIDALRGQPSVTHWRSLADHSAPNHAYIDPSLTDRNFTLLELEPFTGRSHQLRVHLQALGHPILGDALYAPPPIATMAPRLLLHACTLAFTHPLTAQLMQFYCPAEFASPEFVSDMGLTPKMLL